MQATAQELRIFPAVPLHDEFSPHGRLSAGLETCAVPSCPRPARIRVNAEGACGRGHLALLLGAGILAEKARAAKARLSVRPELPVGQWLLRAGSVTEGALADALRAQERAGAGRLGAWLRQQAGLGEQALAAALAAQQGCPVLSLAEWSPEASLAPAALLEQCGAIPLRGQGSTGPIAVAFEDGGSPEMLRALGRIHGRPVVQGVLPATVFWEAARTWLALRQPPVLALEAPSASACADMLCSMLLESGAQSAAFAMLGNRVWLRYTPQSGAYAHHLVCTLPEHAGAYSDAAHDTTLARIA